MGQGGRVRGLGLVGQRQEERCRDGETQKDRDPRRTLRERRRQGDRPSAIQKKTQRKPQTGREEEKEGNTEREEREGEDRHSDGEGRGDRSKEAETGTRGLGRWRGGEGSEGPPLPQGTHQ